MNENEFNEFMDTCYEELENKQKALIDDYNLSTYEEFWYDQATGTIQFKTAGKVELEFFVVPIGSWSGESESWMWAWANDSVTDELREKSAKIKEVYGYTGFDVFEDEAFEANVGTAQALMAIAIHHLDAMGMYIAPHEQLKSFLALMEVKKA